MPEHTDTEDDNEDDETESRAKFGIHGGAEAVRRLKEALHDDDG